MAKYSRELLSASTDGRAIVIAATATPGTLIHTAAVVGVLDEVWLWVANSGALTNITLEWGGVGAANQMTTTYPVAASSAALLLVPGFVLTNGLTVRAFVANANRLNVAGYVNRYTP